MEEFKDRMVSAAGWEGKMRPVNVNGMFFADNPDKMDGWGCGMGRRKNNWALWVDGHGFVCGGENMCYPVRPCISNSHAHIAPFTNCVSGRVGAFFLVIALAASFASSSKSSYFMSSVLLVF